MLATALGDTENLQTSNCTQWCTKPLKLLDSLQGLEMDELERIRMHRGPAVAGILPEGEGPLWEGAMVGHAEPRTWL